MLASLRARALLGKVELKTALAMKLLAPALGRVVKIASASAIAIVPLSLPTVLVKVVAELSVETGAMLKLLKEKLPCEPASVIALAGSAEATDVRDRRIAVSLIRAKPVK